MVVRHNAKALRVIGQDLAALGVNEFNLRKHGDDYRVWFQSKETNRNQPSLFLKLSRMILGSQKAAGPIPTTIRFSTAQLLWTDAARSMSRKGTKIITDLNELSLMLRALGNLLDDKEADEFHISWESSMVKVVSDKEAKNFRLLDLYDRGTHLYLRRSDRLRRETL